MSFTTTGLPQLRAAFNRVPEKIRDEVTIQVEREAERLVKQISQQKPVGIDGNPIDEIEVGWTWGAAPRGSITLGSVANNKFAKVQVTVYARGKPGSGFGAAWFEFGTEMRVQKTTGKETGILPAQPFFWPNYRDRRKFIKRNLRAAITRGIKKAMKGS